MKKSAIVVMTSFYLLLTTGMFVCLLHCSTQYLVSKIEHCKSDRHDYSKSAASYHEQKNRKKGCSGDKDCSSCKKHSNYFVKENIKPPLEYSISEISLTSVISFSYLALPAKAIKQIRWHQCKAPPPGPIGPGIFIRNRSILV